LHDFDPGLQRHHLEKGEHRFQQSPKPSRVGAAEEVGADDRVNVKMERKQHANVEQRWNTLQKRVDQQLELREHAHEAEYPKNPSQSKDGRKGAAGGQQEEGNDGDIEDVPGIGKEMAPASTQSAEPEEDLGDEDRQDEAI